MGIRGVAADEAYRIALFEEYRSYGVWVSFLTNPSARCAFLMRLCTPGGILSLLARNILLHNYSCDVSVGVQILGALYLPHPVGIVIGRDVILHDNVSIYQHVTIGADRQGRYPVIETGAILYSHCIVFGAARIGSNAVVGAAALINRDVAAGEMVPAIRSVRDSTE